MAALFLGLLGSTTTFAQEVSISGDVYPNSADTPNWNVGASLAIGESGTGSMTINTGGSVSNTSGSIGYNAGSHGTVTITGGTWTNSSELKVGYFGTGVLNLNGGVVATSQISNGSGSGTVIFNGGTLQLNANQTDLFAGFEAGNITLAAGGGTLDTQGYTVATTYALTGTGGLTKAGSGSLTLSGANTYSGLTTVSAGTLLNDGTLASDVTVQSGATLGGTGTFSGLVILEAGSTLAASATITFADLTLNAGSTIDFALGDTSNLISVTGDTLTTASTVIFDFSRTGSFTPGTAYTLITGASATNLNGFEPANFTGTGIAGYSFNFTINGNTLAVTATAVPEPATYAILFGAAVLGFVTYRKRSSRRSV